MATENKYVNLASKSATFDSMMKNGFGIVTVMNAKVYNSQYSGTEDTKLEPNNVIGLYTGKPLCTLKTLKVANVTQEGPNKTITGGQYSNPLIKFGKSARLEMQDALGNADAIEALGGATIGYASNDISTISALHFGEEFSGPKAIIGESFFIDQSTGRQIPVKIIFYNFLPDSIFNLTQDAEGDATVFDLNGDLMTTTVKLADFSGNTIESGLFYSIVSGEEKDYVNPYVEITGGTQATPAKTVKAKTGYDVTVDGASVGTDGATIANGAAARVVAKVKGTTTVVYDVVIENY